MKINIPIPTLLLLLLFASCKGQNTVEKQGKTTSKEQIATIGKTVAAIDRGIMVVFQDSKGNYWFGGEGAYKYDGENLVLFTKKDGLCSNAIIGIQEDKSGNIYFDTTEGVSKFDGQNFTTLAVITNNTPKNEWQLAPDDLWFRIGWDSKGPYRYDGQSLYQLTFPKTHLEDEFYAQYPKATFSPYGIYTMYTDSKGQLWFGTAALGVYRYDGKSISHIDERHWSETPSGGSFGIRSIIEDKEGYFWFCNTRHRYQILPDSPSTNQANRINYRKEDGIGKPTGKQVKDFPYFMSIAKDNKGDLWMATYDDGVWRNNGTELIHYPIKDGDETVLLFSIYKDKQGILWLGTHNAGTFKFNGTQFEQFTP